MATQPLAFALKTKKHNHCTIFQNRRVSAHSELGIEMVWTTGQRPKHSKEPTMHPFSSHTTNGFPPKTRKTMAPIGRYIRNIALLGCLLSLFACDPSKPPTQTPVTSCFQGWDQVKTLYPNAGELKSCEGNDKAKAVVNSLLNLQGLKINNNGAQMTPCIEARCDDTYVYIGSNALPHYDFVQTTPNALAERTFLYRLRMTPKAIDGSQLAPNTVEDVAQINGCQAAYTQYLAASDTATTREPSQHCTAQNADKTYFYEQRNGQKIYYRKLSCLGATGFVIAGSPTFGPNEAAVPDPWGNPFSYMPSVAGEPYLTGNLRAGAALDMCFGHTANSMHYHGINEACFARNSEGKPKQSYADATSTWDWGAALTADCTQESAIVGWSLDGVPIKGGCVCTKRNADGTCATLKRTRSSWVYRGLKEWGTDPKEDQQLGTEGKTCTQDGDCCPTNNCNYRCKYALSDDTNAPGGTSASKRCVLLDYSWCTHHHIDRSGQDVSQTNFVYLDRCNGYQGADGYAYHVTAAFPLVTGCTKFDADTYPAQNGGNNNNNNPPPKCNANLTTKCCGDGVCAGAKTKENCPEDCN